MNTRIIKIAFAFATLSEALEHAVTGGLIDISYNERAAREKAKQADRQRSGNGWTAGTQRAYHVISEQGFQIMFAYRAEDGVVLLNEFDPFIAVLHDGGFDIATVNKEETEITVHEFKLPKTAHTRSIFASTAANGIMAA